MKYEKSSLSFISSLYGGYWNYDLLDFCYMINPYFPPEEMLDEIVSNFIPLSKSYPSNNWHISSLLSENLNIDPSNIVVGNGASELISAMSHLFIRNLTIPVPTFDEYPNRLKIQGKDVSYFEIDKKGFSLNPDSFVEFVKTSTSNAALIIQPNNPTGQLVSKKGMKYLLDELANLDLVIVDESFIDFVSSEKNPSVLECINDYENLIVIKSLSKVYGIPGLRLGYAASGNVITMSALRKELPIWNVNSFAQYFIQLLGNYRKEYEHSCRRVIETTKKLNKKLCGVSYLHPYPTDANFVFCETKNDFTSPDLTSTLFNKFNILINDCSSKIGMDDRFVRIASRTEEENRELIDALMDMGE